MSRDRLHDAMWDQATVLLEKKTEEDRKNMDKGSLVMLRNRPQRAPRPMCVSKVYMLGTRRMFHVDGHKALWPESSFMPYKEWLKENSNAS